MQWMAAAMAAGIAQLAEFVALSGGEMRLAKRGGVSCRRARNYPRTPAQACNPSMRHDATG
jgi:hypothetical protein